MAAITTLLLNGLVALGALVAARGGLKQTRGLPACLAAATLGWAWVVIGLQVLGAVGHLNRSGALGHAALGAALGLAVGGRSWRTRRPDERHVPAPFGAEPEANWDVATVLAVGLTIAAAVLLGSDSLLGPVKVVSDGPIYHLYFAIRWWQAGRLVMVPVPFGESAATYFPANGDLWFTWLVVGWGGDRLARIGQAPFLLLAGLAAYAIARRLGAGRPAAVVATCWFLACVPLMLFTFETNVDTIFVAGYLLAAWFFLRYALGDDGLPALALGGLAAGLAWGTKPTGTVFVPPLLGLAALATFRRRATEESLRRRLRDALILAGSALLPIVFWFGRNVWLTGNPLYPLEVRLLGWAGWFSPDAMRFSPYYLSPFDLRVFSDIVLSVIDPRLALVWAAALAGAWAIGPGGRQYARWLYLAAGLALLNVALYWLLIPYRSQQRFFLQAVGLAAIPLARLLDRGWVLRLGAAGLLGVHLLTRQTWPFPSGVRAPWDLSTRIPNSFPGLLRSPASWPEGLAWLLAASFLTALAWAAATRRPGSARRMAALAVGVVLTGSWTAYWWSTDAMLRRESFYPSFPDFYRGWLAVENQLGAGRQSIAYAGTNIPYYLFGRRLGRNVRYVAVDDHPGWLLHDYHRRATSQGRPHWPNPRPGWDREDADEESWLANLRAAGVDVLVVTRVNPGEGVHNVNPADPLGFSIERLWAEAHPEVFEPLYGLEEADPQFRAYRLRKDAGRREIAR